MAEDKNYKNDKEIVQETHDLWRTYSNNRDTWANQAQEDKEFRLGRQWTSEQVDTLTARGQAPLVVNRIHPAVESAKAMITANRPSFRVAPREDSDNKTAQVLSALMSYMYDISDGRTVIRNVVDDYYVIISRLYTRDQAKKLYPMYERAIENAASDMTSDRPSTDRKDEIGLVFPEDTETSTQASTFGKSSEYIRGYERYYKKSVEKFRIFEQFSGKEDLLDDNDFIQYVQQPAWVVNGQIFTDQAQANAIVEQVQAQIQMEYDQHIRANNLTGDDLPEPPQVDVKQITYQDLIDNGQIKVVQVSLPRVYICVIIGDKKLYSRELPIENYPVVPFCNIHTRTPFPIGDVRMVKEMQEYINKTRSLIVAHATTSTNVKILVPEGSVDMKEFEEKWAQPGVAIAVDMDNGAPQPVQPMPLPNELYKNEQDAKNDIDHQLGLYEMMQGNSAVAPQTYKATIALDEFGQRKIKSKLADIEAGLTRVGQVAIPLMQQLYTTEKIFRVVQPNNSLSEYVLNRKLVDDKSGEIQMVNDIGVGLYDVIVVAGSTLPTNRYAELEFYMDAYAKGLIDKQEVLKKTEVFDIEGVMERTDTIAQLQQQLQSASQEIKKLKGDQQTRDRENVNLKQRVEVEKMKTALNKVKTDAGASATIFDKRLDDALANVKSDIRNANKKSLPSSKRGS